MSDKHIVLVLDTVLANVPVGTIFRRKTGTLFIKVSIPLFDTTITGYVALQTNSEYGERAGEYYTPIEIPRNEWVNIPNHGEISRILQING